MTLSARTLDEYDRCERRFAFSRDYASKLISPLGALYSAMEAALVADDPEQEAKDATMRLASTHDLMIGDLTSFQVIRHIGYLAGIVAVALRERFGPLMPLESTADWESGLFQTESGKLHRFELVSHFDDDRLRSCAHSWRVIGELAALERPITLTAVVIGPQRSGRRHSEWSKGFRHPANKALRFAPRNNKKSGFSDGWEKVWRELEQIPTGKWLAQMKQDAVMESLIVSREIAYKPADNRMVAARREMREIAEAMEEASVDAPMRRSSCDEFGGCPFATVCYHPVAATPADFPHLYRIREQDTPAAGPEGCTSGRRTAASPRPLEVVRKAQGLLHAQT